MPSIPYTATSTVPPRSGFRREDPVYLCLFIFRTRQAHWQHGRLHEKLFNWIWLKSPYFYVLYLNSKNELWYSFDQEKLFFFSFLHSILSKVICTKRFLPICGKRFYVTVPLVVSSAKCLLGISPRFIYKGLVIEFALNVEEEIC